MTSCRVNGLLCQVTISFPCAARDYLHHIPVATELQMKTARNRIGEVMEGWRVVAQPRQNRGVLLYEIQHLCGFKRTVYPQDWQRGLVACPKCKYDRTVGR